MTATMLSLGLLLTILTSAPALNSTLPHTSHQEEQLASFSYDLSAPDGPPRWATLDPAYGLCATGLSQSPIDFPCPAQVSNPQVLEAGPIVSTTTTQLKFERTTSNFELACETVGNCGSLQFNGVQFDLVNIHFHSPSEHQIGGVVYPLEAHMVHASSEGELLVLSIMFSDGTDDDCLSSAPFFGGINAPLTVILTRASVGLTELLVDTGAFLAADTAFSMYSGSLTTPPCSEGVTWLLANRRQTISRREVLKFLELTDSVEFGNARDLQALNGRRVLFAPAGRTPAPFGFGGLGIFS